MKFSATACFIFSTFLLNPLVSLVNRRIAIRMDRLERSRWGKGTPLLILIKEGCPSFIARPSQRRGRRNSPSVFASRNLSKFLLTYEPNSSDPSAIRCTWSRRELFDNLGG